MDNKINLICIVILIFLLPIAHGGTLVWPQTMAIVIMAIPLLMLAIFTDFNELKSQKTWLYPWLCVTLLIGLQLIPYKPFDFTGTDFEGLKSRISPDPGMTIGYWVVFTLYWVVAWIVSRLETNQIIIIVCCITVLLVFEAVYGLIAHINNYQKILDIWPLYNTQVVSGTFLNRNHYAAIFELSTPIVFSLLLTRLFSEKFNFPLRFCLGLFLLFLFSLAVFTTYSRLGLVCFLIAILIWILLVSNFLGLKVNRKKYILYLSCSLIFILVTGLWFGLEPILARFETVGENYRYLMWQTVISELPKSTWLWGMGAGTLLDNFKLINPIEINKTVLQLHNDWLEFLLDFGLIGALIIIISFIYWFKTMKPRRFKVLQYGAISGIIALAIHAFGDFPLQIPGVAILFWIMVGIVMNKQLCRHKK